MAQGHIEEKLIAYMQDAHAMERNVSAMLGSMIKTTEDPEIRGLLEHHLEETERHERLLGERLEAYGRSPSITKEAGALAAALGKSLTDKLRDDKPAKNARDGYMTEHMEIAAYELLERLAERAGDEETAEVARRNRNDEKAMANKIANRWDTFVDLSLSGDDAAPPLRLAG